MKHATVSNYGSDPCAFLAVYTNTYGGDYSFEDVSLDLEGGGNFSLALFYVEQIAYTSTVLKVLQVYAGAMGWAPIFKLRCVQGPPTWPPSWLDAESIAADSFGGVVDVDGSSWIGEVRNALADHGPYVYSSMANGRPAVTVVDKYSRTFPRYASWIAGTAVIKVPGPVDGQYQELRVAADGIHGSATPPQWAGLNAIQANAASSLAAYALDHSSIAASLSGEAAAGGYLAGYTGAYPAAATLFGGTTLGTAATLTLAGTSLGGTYTLSYGGYTTAGLSPTASFSTIQAALQGLTSIGSGNVAVGGNNGGPYTITFTGTMAKLAGAALGLTVNGSGLTATGPSVTVTSNFTSFITFGGVTGGTFMLSGGGFTTAPLAWNATGPQIQAAILAAGINATYGPLYLVPIAQPGVYYEINANVTINASGLTGGASATLAGTTVPFTWYVGLSTEPAYAYGTTITEPMAGTSGYARVAIANNTTDFGASSAGSKTSGVAVTFPTATGAYTVQSIGLLPSPTSTHPVAVIQLATPLVVAAGTTPTIPLGALTFTHTPYAGNFAGGMTDYAWGKIYDLFFGGSSFTVPSTWYVALSTAAVSRTTTSLTEPVGGSYTRTAIANSPTNWLVADSNDFYGQTGDTRNAATIAFPAPTAAWGSVVATALADSATGGNVWFVGSLTAPVAPATGAPAPAFAAGAFTLATA